MVVQLCELIMSLLLQCFISRGRCTLRLKSAQISKLVEGQSNTVGFDKVNPTVEANFQMAVDKSISVEPKEVGLGKRWR